MPKKYQVIVPDWMEDYINFCMEKYELKASDVFRLQVSFAAICLVDLLYPEFETDISMKEVCDQVLTYSQSNREELMRIISKINFEARKAVEYRLKQEKTE